jgi:hypothetical protein
MLEICPETEPIFQAGRLESDLMPICREMSVSAERERRLALLKKAEVLVAKMRENAILNFGGRPFIMDNLKGLEGAIRELAESPSAFKSDSSCPVCGGPIKIRFNLTKTCDRCMEPILNYRDRLASEDGFRTRDI